MNSDLFTCFSAHESLTFAQRAGSSCHFRMQQDVYLHVSYVLTSHYMRQRCMRSTQIYRSDFMSFAFKDTKSLEVRMVATQHSADDVTEVGSGGAEGFDIGTLNSC